MAESREGVCNDMAQEDGLMESMALVVSVCSGYAGVLGKIESLASFAARGNKVYLVGEEEADLPSLPKGVEAVRSERGYAEFCNELVEELRRDGISLLCCADGALDFDEEVLFGMEKALLCADRNGIVSPRMRRAPFFELPFGQCDFPDKEKALDECLAVAKQQLPLFSIVPFASSCIFCIKVDLALNFGLFDATLDSYEAQVRDCCSRINQYGYSSVIANHVYQKGAFDNDGELAPSDEEELAQRYPWLMGVVHEYLSTKMLLADRFLDLLVPSCHEKPRLLFEFSVMPSAYNGTSEFQISLLEHFFQLYRNKYKIFVRANLDAIRFHDLMARFPGFTFFYGDTSETFHIGMSATQPSTFEPIQFLHSHCLKIVFSLLDIIMWRTDYLRKDDLCRRDVLLQLGASVSDGLIAISDYSKKDFLSYLPFAKDVVRTSLKMIHIATDAPSELRKACPNFDPPFAEFYLIAGNHFRHKALRETVKALAGTEGNYVVIGLAPEDCPEGNFVGLEGGMIDDEIVDYLYSNCKALVFPSVYEGYGLPIVMALRKGKPVLVHDNPLNRELRESLPEVRESFFFFRSFSEIGSRLEDIEKTPGVQGGYLRNWSDCVVEIEAYLWSLLCENVSSVRLEQRAFLIKLGESYMGDLSLLATPLPSSSAEEQDIKSGVAGKIRGVLRTHAAAAMRRAHRLLGGFRKSSSEVDG